LSPFHRPHPSPDVDKGAVASMTQGVLGFKYEEERHATGMTGLSGLPIYLDLLHTVGLPGQIGRHLRVKQRGWTDAQMVSSLMLLNIAGSLIASSFILMTFSRSGVQSFLTAVSSFQNLNIVRQRSPYLKRALPCYSKSERYFTLSCTKTNQKYIVTTRLLVSTALSGKWLGGLPWYIMVNHQLFF
jgi:hypothetical protein